MRIGKKITMVLFSTMLVLLLFGYTNAKAQEQQIVTPDPTSVSVAPGSDAFTITANYDVSDGDNTLSGLGLKIHYDSSILEWINFNNVLQTSKTGESTAPQDDIGNTDNDTATDKIVLVSWADLGGNWPNQTLPLALFDISFKVRSTVTSPAQTTINFTASSTAADYEFQSSSVTVNVVAPGISVAPSSYEFGAVPVGDSKTQSFTITNTENDALNIDQITLDGTNAADFSIQNDTCSNQTVAQNGACTFDVVFSPKTAGRKTADISIPSNAPGSPTTVPIDGVGAGFGTTPNNSVSISGVPYSVACDGSINGGVPITVSENNLGLTISVNSTEISDGYDQIHQIGAVIVDDSAQIDWASPDKNDDPDDLAGQSIRYLKAILDQVRVKKENGEVSVTVPQGALVYFKARTAGGTWISGSVENKQENGPVTTQNNTVTFDPGNLIQKVTNAVQNRTDFNFNFCNVPGKDVALNGNYKFWVLTDVPLACYETGSAASFTSSGSLSNVSVHDLTDATMLYGTVKLTAETINNLFCPDQGGSTDDGGTDGDGTGGDHDVNNGGTVASGDTVSVPAGKTVSDVTNEGTIKNSGTVKDSANKGTIEGGTVAGTITNTDGTLKDVAIAENAVVKGGSLEGAVTIGEGASLENVTVAANATVKLSGADIVVNIVTESGSKLVLAPGSSMHGMVGNSEGACLNIPEGAIVTITGNSITIQFSKPDIPVSGQAAIAALTVPALPGQYTLVDALTVSPDGATLAKPATVTIPYDKTNIPEGFTKADFKVLALDPATIQWKEIPVTSVTDDNVFVDTNFLSTYAVVVSSLYPVISTAAGNVIDPESVSAPIENALKEMLPDNSISVNPDKTSGILNVNIDGTLYPISAIGTGSAESQSKAGFELKDGGVSAQFILSNGTTIQIAPMAADPQGLTDILTASNELTVQFQPDYGMVIVKDASNNRYAGMFGWTAGSFGTKAIDEFNSTGGVINIVYKDGSTQTLAPVLGSIQKFITDFNNAGIAFNIDRNTGIISLINPSSCWVPDYTMKPLSFDDLVNEYLINKDANGIYFKINSSQNVEMWTNLGKQLIMQTQCK